MTDSVNFQVSTKLDEDGLFFVETSKGHFIKCGASAYPEAIMFLVSVSVADKVEKLFRDHMDEIKNTVDLKLTLKY